MKLRVNKNVYSCNCVIFINDVLTLFDNDTIVVEIPWDYVYKIHKEDNNVTYLHHNEKIYSMQGSMIKNINLEDVYYDEDVDILYYGLLYEYLDLFGDDIIMMDG